MARRHPPGRRGAEGRRRGDRRHRPGRADHGAGFLPALPAALAGMTGTGARVGRRAAARSTAATCCRFPPTGRPSASGCPTAVFGTADDQSGRPSSRKSASMHATGRPVLIGTRSIDKSEHLSRCCCTPRASSTRCSTPTTSPTRPRSSPRPAGMGKVTVSTNMAGRGTDIKLGDGVAELGGLHVICTEMHDSARIDRQLIGRCGRQGDPGTYRQLSRARRRSAADRPRPEKAEYYSRASDGELAGNGSIISASARSARPSAKSSAATSATARR